MIPKVIHYIWLGKNPMPKVFEKCLRSWKKFCPDFEIKKWDETNLDINKYKFSKQAYESEKFAFASDVLRTEILYREGGIYLDVDVELLKPIDEFLTLKSFSGFETSNIINPGLIYGCEKGNEDLGNILEVYKNLEFDINKMKENTVCEIYTKYFEKQGLERVDKTQEVGSSVFFASEYFSPISTVTNKMQKTDKTHSVHWYCASWYTGKQKFLRKIKKVLNVMSFGLLGKCYQKIKQRKKK